MRRVRLPDAEQAGSFVDLMSSHWTEANRFDRLENQLDVYSSAGLHRAATARIAYGYHS